MIYPGDFYIVSMEEEPLCPATVKNNTLMENSGSSFSTLKTMPLNSFSVCINRAAFCPNTCYQQGKQWDLGFFHRAARGAQRKGLYTGGIWRSKSWTVSAAAQWNRTSADDKWSSRSVQGEKVGTPSTRHRDRDARTVRTDRMTPRVPNQLFSFLWHTLLSISVPTVPTRRDFVLLSRSDKT